MNFTRKITSTHSSTPGTVELLFYTAPSHVEIPKSTISKGTHISTPSTKKRPLLVNFHGGGWTIGHAGDDARWATAITSQTDAIVCSVNYRLAPSHPFPTPIEDCLSAIFWLWAHAEELNIDINRTALSGFSAGGNLAYAVSIRLHEEIEGLKKDGKFDGVSLGKIVSLVSFYGSSDWTQTREERNASNPNLIPVIPPFLFKLFDTAYLQGKEDMRSPLLSPGLAPDEILRAAFPRDIIIMSCGGDQLLAEDQRFGQRLSDLGKEVHTLVVEDVGHAWDKQPSFGKGNPKRNEAYGFAVSVLKKIWDEAGCD